MKRFSFVPSSVHISYDLCMYLRISKLRSSGRKRNVKVHQGCNSSLQSRRRRRRRSKREEKLEKVKASSYPVFIVGGREGNENFVQQSTRLASRVFPVTSRWCYVTRRNVVALQSRQYLPSIHPSRPTRVNGPSLDQFNSVNRGRDRPVIT